MKFTELNKTPLLEQLLNELIVGKGKRSLKLPQYWVFLNTSKIYFIPKLSDSITKDAVVFFGTYDKWSKIEYGSSDQHQRGFMLVDTVKQELNLDITKFTSKQIRRKDEKIFGRVDSNNSYPIFQGDLGFERIVELEKALKILVKLKPELANFTIIGDDRLHGKTPNDVIGAKNIPGDHRRTFDIKNQTIELYHGTSQDRYDEIKRVGLKPGERDGVYSDMIDGYSTNNIYLTFNPASAANYATREAIEDKSNPVILKVTLNQLQISKLLPDEDSMHWMATSVDSEFVKRFARANPMLRDIWDEDGTEPIDTPPNIHIKNLDHENKRFKLSWIIDELNSGWLEKHRSKFLNHAKTVMDNYGLNTAEKILEAEHSLYISILKTFIEGTFKSSVKKQGSLAYPGKILPSSISIEKTWTLKGTKLGPKDGQVEYNTFIDKQAKTVKRPNSK